MADKREQILARLLVLAAGLEGIVTAVRNEPLVDEMLFPVVQILDADETSEDRDPPMSGRGLAVGAQRVGMTPEIYITLGAAPEAVGTAINVLRGRLIKAVLEDAELRTLTGPNGGIRYEGCATGLSRGRTLEGEMGVSFTFTYLLKTSDL